MNTHPEIMVSPKGAQTRPQTPIPVLATLHRVNGAGEFDVPAAATAWTRDAVQVTWLASDLGLISSWVPTVDVRRGEAASERLKRGAGRGNPSDS